MKTEKTNSINSHKNWGVSTVVLTNGIISTIISLYLISLTVSGIRSFHINRAPFVRAILWGDVKALKHIIDDGGDVNGKLGKQTVLTSTMAYMTHSANPLRALDEEKLKEELERRNKVRMKMIEVLLDNGADINLLDDNGWNILHYAVDKYIDFNSKVDLVEMLLKRGADPNIKDKTTEVQYSISFVHFSTYDAEEMRGTVLHTAIRNNEINIVEILLKNGADINILNDEGESPLKIALNEGFQEIVNILKKHGATK